MPELPEVETIKNALAAMLAGRRVTGVETAVAALREPVNGQDLRQQIHGEILAVRRRAKYLLFDFSGGRCLLAHLGMTGSFRVEKVGLAPRKHDRVFFLLDKNEKLVYNDIRCFGVIKSCKLDEATALPAELAGLGPEPLEKEFDAKYLQSVLARCKGPVKPFLMRQDIIVGVGNIYASEALFETGISPLRPGKDISPAECKTLAATIKSVLRRAIKQGGTTISDYRQPDGSEGKFAQRLKAYGRAGQPCRRPGCGGTVGRITQGGRATFYCDQCQR